MALIIGSLDTASDVLVMGEYVHRAAARPSGELRQRHAIGSGVRAFAIPVRRPVNAV
jgi:hypothetical protein